MGMTVLFKGNFLSLNGNISSNPCRLTKSYAFTIWYFPDNFFLSERNVGKYLDLYL